MQARQARRRSDSGAASQKKGRGLTEDAAAYVFETGENGVDAVVAEFEGRVEVTDGFWEELGGDKERARCTYEETCVSFRGCRPDSRS